MDRLKPCPFCGSKDIKLFGNHRDSFWFRCNKCASIDSYDTERQAVRAWNKRVAIPSAEPRYCDRNICLKNEYNGIGCDECEVTKSQEPCEDAISRSGAIKAIEERAKRIKNEDTLNGLAGAVGILFELPSVKPQDCDTCEVGNPCLYCKHEFEPQESEEI